MYPLVIDSAAKKHDSGSLPDKAGAFPNCWKK
jgi:hypothetical protein